MAGIIALIINLLLVVCVVLGFLIGVGRGLVKSSIRSGWLLGFLVLFLLLTPVVARGVSNIYIGALGNTLSGWVSGQINDAIAGSTLASNEAFQGLITALPSVVVGMAVWILLVMVAILFSWIAYLITKRVKKQRMPQEDVQKIVRVKDGKPMVLENKTQPKKRRLLGGLVGAVMGFGLCFFLLLPVTGAVRVTMQYISPADITTAVTNQSLGMGVQMVGAAEQKNNFEYGELSKTLTSTLPAEFLETLSAVNNSAVVKIMGLANVDLLCYDMIASTHVAGQRVTLRQEMRAAADTAECVMYVSGYLDAAADENKMVDWRTFDFGKVERCVNSAFSSGLVNTLGVEILQDFLNMAKNGTLKTELTGNLGMDAQTAEYVQMIVKEVQISLGNNIINGLKQDVLAFVGGIKAIGQSGALNLINNLDGQSTKQIIKQICDCCLGKSDLDDATQTNYLSKAMNSVLNSPSIKGLLVGGVNVGAAAYGQSLQQQLNEEKPAAAEDIVVALPQLVQSNALAQNWQAVKDGFANFVSGIVALMQFEAENDLLETEITAQNLAQIENASSFFENLGAILQGIINNPLFQYTADNQNLMHALFENVGKLQQVSNVVNLGKLANVQWAQEMNAFEDFWSFIKPVFAASNTQAFDFGTLDFANLKTSGAATTMFGGKIAEALKVDWLMEKLALDQQNSQVLDAVLADASTLSDLSASVSALVEVGCELCQTNILSLPTKNAVTATDIQTAATALLQKNSEQNTRLAQIFEHLTTNSNLCAAFVAALNQFVVPTVEVDEVAVGTIQTANFANYGQNVRQSIVPELEKLLQIYLDVNIASFEDFTPENTVQKVFAALVDDNFAGEDGTAIVLGKVLDALCNNAAFNATKEVAGTPQTTNILQQFLVNNLAAIQVLDAQAIQTGGNTFWQDNLGNLADGLVVLTNTPSATQGSATLLDMLLFGGDIQALAESDGFMALTSEDMQIVVNSLIGSPIIKPATLQMLDFAINSFATLFDNAFESQIAPATNLQVQQSTLVSAVVDELAVLKVLKNNSQIQTLEDLLTTASSESQKMLESMKANADQNGVYKQLHDALFAELQTQYGAYLTSLGVAVTAQNVEWASVIAELQSHTA